MNGPDVFWERMYRLILRAYPREYMDIFGDEMLVTFMDGVNQAEREGALGKFILYELRNTPASLIRAYWNGWVGKLLAGIQILEEAVSASDLPPAAPDGRESWQQFFWEVCPFLVSGLLLIVDTYSPFQVLRSGWQRDIGLMGNIILPITIPFLILGVMRGLPRWVYPFAGLLLCYIGFIAGQTGLWLFFTIMLFASSMLLIAAILTDPQPTHLPVLIRRIGQSLSLDWTRLSFGVYGAMPLIILMAFDDAHLNSHTPYFAFSVLAMIAGALLYCRGLDTTMQFTTLLAGLTFAIWGAWLDKISFASGLMNWTIVSSMGLESIAWMGILWIQWAFLILSPVGFILLNGLVHRKRAV